MHIHKQAFTSLKKKITDCLIYCILSNGEVIKYHKFISVVVIELSFRCLNTGPEDRLYALVQLSCGAQHLALGLKLHIHVFHTLHV